MIRSGGQCSVELSCAIHPIRLSPDLKAFDSSVVFVLVTFCVPYGYGCN